jgi:type VI secretion system secreted protein Hcp
MAIYMNYDNLSIKGDATQGNHVNWIGIESFHFGLGRGIMTVTGQAQNRETSEPSVGDVAVTKGLDSASTLLFQTACTGKEGKTIIFDFCRSDEQGAPYLTVQLTNALISNFSTMSSGGKPVEQMSLSYSKIELQEKGGSLKNSDGQPVKVSYDLGTASKK